MIDQSDNIQLLALILEIVGLGLALFGIRRKEWINSKIVQLNETLIQKTRKGFLSYVFHSVFRKQAEHGSSRLTFITLITFSVIISTPIIMIFHNTFQGFGVFEILTIALIMILSLYIFIIVIPLYIASIIVWIGCKIDKDNFATGFGLLLALFGVFLEYIQITETKYHITGTALVLLSIIMFLIVFHKTKPL